MNNTMFAVNLSTYTQPEVTEDKRNGWVAYGDDNDYFDYILGRYYGSTTNNAIINGIADMIAGQGLDTQGRNSELYAKVVTLFKYDDIKRWAFDLKCMGYYIIMITRSRKGDVIKCEHTPVQNWRAGIANGKGEVKEYFYSDDWEIAMREYEPVSYPVYDNKKKDSVSVMAVKPFRAGSFYYPAVDYQGALQYAQLEEEIANFHVNNIMNGLSPSAIINFNNGVPDEEERRKIKQEITKNAQGSSNSGRWLVTFNDNKERAVTIETLQVTDADKQYEFLSSEAMKKILVGHRVTSPLLFGIREEGGGLGSNKDEIIASYQLFSKMVLMPFQQLMISSFEQILRDEGLNVPLTIKPLQPIEQDQQQEQMHTHLSSDLDDFIAQGEVMSDEWELIDEREVDYDLEDELNETIKQINLAKVPSSNPNGKSEQDTSLFKVRYVYAPETTDAKSEGREFCKKMISAKKVYRKEDIEAAGNRAVNPGFGKGGSDTYSIWLYKGGVACHHFWQRQTYLRRNNKKITVNEAKRLINKLPPDERKDARLPENDKKVAKRPVDMPRQARVN